MHDPSTERLSITGIELRGKSDGGQWPKNILTHIDPVGKPTVKTYSGDRKEKPFIPPFLLTFEVFNRNLHNCL
jgi:hypothetical protein